MPKPIRPILLAAVALLAAATPAPCAPRWIELVPTVACYRPLRKGLRPGLAIRK